MSTSSKRPSGFDVAIPFVEGAGIELLEFSRERVLARLDVQDRHSNSSGFAHGGAVMTLLDVSMAMAGRLASDAPDQTAVATIEMKTAFMQGAKGRLLCSGYCVHRTRSLAFCEAEVRDADGALVAKGSGTFKFMQRKGG